MVWREMNGGKELVGKECRIGKAGRLMWQEAAKRECIAYHLGKVLNFPPVPMDSWHRNGSDQFQVARLSISPPNIYLLVVLNLIKEERPFLGPTPLLMLGI